MSRLLIQLLHVFKSFGSLSLFEDLSFSINEGDIFALIGENGAGKTTLLELLKGSILPDSGYLNLSPSLTIGFLPQEISLINPTAAVRDYLEDEKFSEIELKMAVLLEDPERLLEWEKLHETFEMLGGYRRVPLEKIFSGLKLETALLDVSMSALSSGQRMRVALAKALIENPDLLLLDEPTNHLDQEMLSWLKTTLQSRRGATLIVSHDRKFLNATCQQLIEIKEGKLTCYGGNYDFYLEEKERLKERQLQAYLAQEEERALLKEKIKAMNFAKKKPPPPTDRNKMAYDRRGEYHQKSVKHHLDLLKKRLNEIESNPFSHPKPKSIKGLKFESIFLASPIAIELEKIEKSFGERVLFSQFDQRLCQGDRVILTGPNGSGKTTLLRCIAGLLPLDRGHIRYASHVKIAYLDQEAEQLPMTKTPLQYFEERFNLSKESLLRELHMAALGGKELLDRPFLSLSVGQRKRLMLLSLILEKPNVLLLDEPTNHLDLLTLEAFEKALLQFKGAILAVSHDSTFIEKMATERWRL